MLWLLLLVFPLLVCQDRPCPASSPCIVATSCPWYLESLKQKSSNWTEKRERLAALRKSICNKHQRKVCCAKLKDGNAEEIPKLKDGNAEAIAKLKDGNAEAIEKLKDSNAEAIQQEEDVSTERNFTSSRDTSLEPRVSNHSSPGWIPSASKGECGDEYFAFIVGGGNTMLGEMPWTALLGAVKEDGFKWKCGGAVINKWFVLTAAHCNPVTSVRLGEWRVVDASRPNRRRGIVFSEAQREECEDGCWNYARADGTRDCTNGGATFRFATEGTTAHCGPSYQEFEVMKSIVHPGYRILQSGVTINDIAMIKLSRPAILSSEGDSLVSPICLPLTSEELMEDKGGEGTVVGYGKTYINDGMVDTISSVRQKKLKMPMIGNMECRNLLSKLFNKNLQEDITQQHHLCAGGVKGKDSCSGDSGGPFIVKNDLNSPYILAGLLSFGTARCGIGVPSVFTRIRPKLNWIKENLSE